MCEISIANTMLCKKAA